MLALAAGALALFSLADDGGETSRVRAGPASLAPPIAGRAGAGTTPWSAPLAIGTCAAASDPVVAVPRDSPTHATGGGAVAWSVGDGCPGGAGTLVSVLGPGDMPGSPRYARESRGRPLALGPPLALASAPHGELAIAGSPSPHTAASALLQGAAGRAFSPLASLPGSASQGGLATGYLGDLAVASSGTGGAQLRVERYFARSLSPARALATSAAEALTVGLDYRTDAIAAWRQGGVLYARELPARGAARPPQRLAALAPHPHISVLISDNERAMVAWANQRGAETSVYLDYSASGVRFGPPQLLERFRDPDGLPDPSGSPRLVRLSSESVMIAWSGARAGRWAIRTAAIDLDGLRSVATLDTGARDALLDDLVPGPDGEALALWREPQRTPKGGLDTSNEALFAARGVDAYPGLTIFGASEQIAPPAPNGPARAAFDPDTDRAVAVWRGQGGRLEYSIRDGHAR